MRKMFLFASMLFSLNALAQTTVVNINPVYSINRYTVPGQAAVTEAKTSTLHTKAEAAAIACKCKVPFRTEGYYDGTVLKASSSAAASKSSVAVSSVPSTSSSSLSVSSVPDGPDHVILTANAPTKRVNGDAFPLTEAKSWHLKLGSNSNIEIAVISGSISYRAPVPKTGEVYQIAIQDTALRMSDYVTFI